MADDFDRLTIATEPGEWDVTLTTGCMIHLRATGFARVDDSYIFSMLMEGVPPYMFTVAIVPAGAVLDITGG